MQPEKHQRPGGETEALTESFGGDVVSVGPRCIVCGHVLTAERSVELGIGPICRRLAVVA